MAITPSTSFISVYDPELDAWIGYTDDYANVASESKSPAGALAAIREMVK